MAEDDPDIRRLDELERKLKQARGAREPEPAPESRQSQLGVAFRLVAELVVAVVVGGPLVGRLTGFSDVAHSPDCDVFRSESPRDFATCCATAREMNKIGADKD